MTNQNASKQSKLKTAGVYKKPLKNGDFTYYITYRCDGKLYNQKVGKKSEGMTIRLALQERANRINQEVERIVVEPLSSKSFQSVYQSYLNEKYRGKKEESKKTIVTTNALFKHFKEYHDRDLCQITKENIEKILDDSYDKGNGDKTANDILAFFRRIYNYAYKNDYVTCPDVSQKLEMKKVKRERSKILNQEDITKLIEAIDEDGNKQLKLFVQLALGTAARISSLCDLKKMDCNMNQKLIKLYNFKSKKYYTLQMSDFYFDSLQERLDQIKDFQYVLNFDGHTDLKRRIQRKIQPYFDEELNALESHKIWEEDFDRYDRLKSEAYKELSSRYSHVPHKIVERKAARTFAFGIQVHYILIQAINMDILSKVTTHTLRHTAATMIYNKHKDIYAVSKILDHHSVNVTQRYAKYDMPKGILDGIYITKESNSEEKKV